MLELGRPDKCLEAAGASEMCDEWIQEIRAEGGEGNGGRGEPKNNQQEQSK
jgi:hypothetical protein